MTRGKSKLLQMLQTKSRAHPYPMLSGKRNSSHGWTIIELMIVISIMMILMAIAIPLYRQHVVQAREAVLKQNLFQLDSLIEQYKLDKGQAPQSLDDLVTAGYLPKLPVDPMTGKADWTTDTEDIQDAVDPQQPGISRAHSASTGTSQDGEAYSTW